MARQMGCGYSCRRLSHFSGNLSGLENEHLIMRIEISKPDRFPPAYYRWANTRFFLKKSSCLNSDEECILQNPQCGSREKGELSFTNWANSESGDIYQK